MKEEKHSNAWNQGVVALNQMDLTHLVSNEYEVPKGDG
jgi:hypothetical protein